MKFVEAHHGNKKKVSIYGQEYTNTTYISVDIFSDEYLDKINAIQLPNTKIKVLQRLLSQAIDEYKKSQPHYGHGVLGPPQAGC